MTKIKGHIRKLLGFTIRFSGISFLIREVLLRNKVTIILYHNPDPLTFRKHIDYLTKHYNLIPLDRVVAGIYNKDWSAIPPKSLVITIDDGFKDNYNLLEIFKEYNVYPTIYLCSHIVNTNRSYWFETGFCDVQKLKRYGNNERLKVLRDKMGYEPLKECASRQALNIEELREMMPHVDFQSHSKFHPVLTTCDDKECLKEIKESKDLLEELLNKKIEHFAYPNGDYENREIEFLKKCGYKSARTLDIGWNDANSKPFKLKAIGIEDDACTNTLCGQIIGLFGYIRYFLHGSFKGMCPPYL
jgi:peptidoglycan/xylan/chitin deacetylase (PgdA/CDA1 family)